MDFQGLATTIYPLLLLLLFLSRLHGFQSLTAMHIRYSTFGFLDLWIYDHLFWYQLHANSSV